MSGASVERMEAVTALVEKIRQTYPDAKKLSLRVEFEWQTPVDADLDSELCPTVKIDIER